MAETITNGIIIDTKALRVLSEDLLAAGRALLREASTTLPKIGMVVASDAARIASASGSTSIPGSITGEMVGADMYRIRAGGPGVPIAGLWEFGNRGVRRDAKSFYHPLFGNRDYPQRQPKYAFMAPALRRNQGFINGEMEMMWYRAAAPYRLAGGIGGGPTELSFGGTYSE